jgi:hypothetical protein
MSHSQVTIANEYERKLCKDGLHLDLISTDVKLPKIQP